jgi:hypothetical protein
MLQLKLDVVVAGVASIAQATPRLALVLKSMLPFPVRRGSAASACPRKRGENTAESLSVPVNATNLKTT